MNFFTMPREGTGVRCTEVTSVFTALVGTFTRAIRGVSRARIASYVAYSLYVQVSREIRTLEGFVCASKVGASIHSVGTGQCRVAGKDS